MFEKYLQINYCKEKDSCYQNLQHCDNFATHQLQELQNVPVIFSSRSVRFSSTRT